MINRHTKRWCPECKLMVFARGHEHGQASSDPLTLSVVNKSDYMMAKDSAEKIIADAAAPAKKAAELEFWRRMGLPLKVDGKS